MAKNSSLKIAVIGCGSIGKRHLQNLAALGVSTIIACDADKQRLNDITRTMRGVIPMHHFEDILTSTPRVDAVIIATPTHLHMAQALACAKKGINLMIEKPLSHSMEGVDALAALVKEKNLVCMMAMCYRFHPVYQKVKTLIDKGVFGPIYWADFTGGHYLPSWHPDQDYRKEYSGRKDMGGGVILTSGIHSFDTIRWLFGEMKTVHCIAGTVSNLSIDVEDVMECIMQSKKGSIVRLHLDFLRREKEDRFQIIGQNAMLKADVVAQRISLWKESTKRWTTTRYKTSTNEMYVKELQHFLTALKKNQTPMPDLAEGQKSLLLTLQAKSQITI